MKAKDFVFDTPFEKGLRLSEVVKDADKTLLIFLRYFGCTSCQMDMIDLAAEAGSFKAKNTQVLVALQSREDIVKNGVEQFKLPFKIICDPKAGIYSLYEVASAGNKEGLMPKTPEEAAKFAAKRESHAGLGLTHGEYEGDEYQLPAYFIIGPDMELIKSHHAQSIADMPTADEYLKLL